MYTSHPIPRRRGLGITTGGNKERKDKSNSRAGGLLVNRTAAGRQGESQRLRMSFPGDGYERWQRGIFAGRPLGVERVAAFHCLPQSAEYRNLG